MKLNYRGQNFNYQAIDTDLTAQEPVGQYRGRNMTFRIKQTPVHEATHDLNYRGVHVNG
jgi:hypothetical protein